jgi:hypothetical protein
MERNVVLISEKLRRLRAGEAFCFEAEEDLLGELFLNIIDGGIAEFGFYLRDKFVPRVAGVQLQIE